MSTASFRQPLSGDTCVPGLAWRSADDPPGALVYGANTTSGAWGNGLRCVASPLQRLGPILAGDANGFLDRTIDLSVPPLGGSRPYAVLPGSTWNFQYVYRDPAGGGANFDTTNGMTVTFCP